MAICPGETRIKKEKKWKTTEEVRGCTVGGYAEGWCGR